MSQLTKEVVHNSCNTGARGLPDMYTLSPRACGPQASGVHIRQTTRACVTTIKCHTSGNKAQTTVVAYVNAIGQAIPPYVIYNAKTLNPEWMKDGPPWYKICSQQK